MNVTPPSDARPATVVLASTFVGVAVFFAIYASTIGFWLITHDDYSDTPASFYVRKIAVASAIAVAYTAAAVAVFGRAAHRATPWLVILAASLPGAVAADYFTFASLSAPIRFLFLALAGLASVGALLTTRIPGSRLRQ